MSTEQRIDLGEGLATFEGWSWIRWADDSTTEPGEGSIILADRGIAFSWDEHPPEFIMLDCVGRLKARATRSRLGSSGETISLWTTFRHKRSQLAVVTFEVKPRFTGVNPGDIPQALLHYVPQRRLELAGIEDGNRRYLHEILDGQHIVATDEGRVRTLEVDFTKTSGGAA